MRHDEAAFAALVEHHRRELRVHCYRMLGSFDEAEDLVQETFLRAWKGIGGFEGPSSMRAWLYRIATNACLDFLDGRARRVLPQDLRPPSDASVGLPPRQRAALLLRDVLGWRPGEIAPVLEGSVASVNSALQRARATLREHLPARRADWAPSTPPTAEERAVLRRYMDAMERTDVAALAALLAEDVRTAMPPWPMWFRGRDTVVAALTASWDPSDAGYVGRFRMLLTR